MEQGVGAISFSGGEEASIRPDQSVLEAATDAGIPVFHVCGGKGKCSTCRVLVLEGEELLSPPNEKEVQLQAQLKFAPNVRLACQTYVQRGHVKLSRIIHDESDVELYVGMPLAQSSHYLEEEKELALFFLDIRDFTPFIERNEPFDVIHIIRKLFHASQQIIDQNQGRIIETAGDELYVAFGFDTGITTAVQQAIDTARAILIELDNLNEQYFNKYFNQTIRVGIGIHAGEVIMGNILMKHADSLMVMGYPVNVAARLQNATKELNNDLVVSEKVYHLLYPSTEEHTSLAVRLKGISSEVTVYLLGRKYR
jgi:adenylate cyclase